MFASLNKPFLGVIFQVRSNIPYDEKISRFTFARFIVKTRSVFLCKVHYADVTFQGQTIEKLKVFEENLVLLETEDRYSYDLGYTTTLFLKNSLLTRPDTRQLARLS